MLSFPLVFVIPAGLELHRHAAEIQFLPLSSLGKQGSRDIFIKNFFYWIPAYAGMTR